MAFDIAISFDPFNAALTIILIVILVKWAKWEKKVETDNGSDKVKLEVPTVVQVEKDELPKS